MFLWLRALTAVGKNTGSIPSIHKLAYNLLIVVLGDPVPTWLSGTPGLHVVHRHTCRQNTRKTN